jgi:LysR family transcriptional regulator, regulator for metE and metH
MVAVTHPARSSPSSTTLDGTHLIVFDSYDPTRVPSLPLPIPAGSRPGKVTTTPVVSELVVELVAAHQGIAILPRWVATPYEAAGRITTVRLSRTPEIRTWHCVTRRGVPPRHIRAFAETLQEHFAHNPTPWPSQALEADPAELPAPHGGHQLDDIPTPSSPKATSKS